MFRLFTIFNNATNFFRTKTLRNFFTEFSLLKMLIHSFWATADRPRKTENNSRNLSPRRQTYLAQSFVDTLRGGDPSLVSFDKKEKIKLIVVRQK